MEQATAMVVEKESYQPEALSLAGGRLLIIYGGEMISADEKGQMAQIIENIDLKGKVKLISFRDDDHPKDGNGSPIFANCCPDLGGICVNLLHTFDQSMSAVLGSEKGTSVVAVYHRNMLLNIIHETIHLTNIGLVDEKECEKMAMSVLVSTAKGWDLEPGTLADNPYFRMQWATTLESMSEDKLKEQVYMVGNHIMFHKPAKAEADTSLILNHFREYMHLLSNEDPNSDEWKKEVKSCMNLKPSPSSPSLYEHMKSPEPAAELNTVADLFEDIVVNPTPVSTMKPFEATIDMVPGEDYYTDYDQPTGAVDMSYAFGGGNSAPTSAFGTPTPTPVQPAFGNFGNFGQPSAGVATPADNIANIMGGLYEKLSNHIFKVCQPVAGSDIGFQFPEGVCITPVQLSPDEARLVYSYTCLDENARFCPNVVANGFIRGMILKNTKLPCYDFICNIAGRAVHRKMIPQNPAKMTNGMYSDMAQQARSGVAICHIFEGDKALEASDPANKHKGKVTNGELKMSPRK